MQHKFYKEENSWYIDLPDYLGNKFDLAMVMGADTMLDYISDGNDIVMLNISHSDDEIPIEYSNKLEYLHDAKDIVGEGAFYAMKNYDNKDVMLHIWLCDVTKFVFGDFPKIIYFEKLFEFNGKWLNKHDYKQIKMKQLLDEHRNLRCEFCGRKAFKVYANEFVISLCCSNCSFDSGILRKI